MASGSDNVCIFLKGNSIFVKFSLFCVEETNIVRCIAIILSFEITYSMFPQHLSTVIPVPKDELNVSCEIQDKRLWIGNLDPRLSEWVSSSTLPSEHRISCCKQFKLTFRLLPPNWYNLLKLLQKYGAIEKFDLLFHRSGPLAGFPRGYAFCTYKNTEDAASAMEHMDGQLVGSKQIIVRWAHSMSKVNSCF